MTKDALASLYAKAKREISDAELVELALAGGEGLLTSAGALAVETGVHTGRSVQDKFIVRDASTERAIWWDNNKPMAPEHFEVLWADFQAHAATRQLYVEDLYAGASPAHRLSARIYVEYAWHALFIRHLLRQVPAAEKAAFAPGFTVVNLPSFRADPKRHGARTETVIACNFARKLVLIGSTSYAGETKKSVFTYLNYVMPEAGVMPMHCSAAHDDQGRSAVFFGLSGTGKTTLSSDPRRTLVGDDEHGWGSDGIFNFEGGCYAKTIRLSAEAEPAIWAATNRFGTVLENVIVDPATRVADYDDGRLTENTRSAYPMDFIPNASPTGVASHPRNVVMLAADAFGVLPPIARLSASQAMYHFLSGYTAKVAGTEKGLGSEPQATFSTCFGAPFMPRHPSVYGNMLRELIAQARGELLAPQHRVDGRQVRRRAAACPSRPRARCSMLPCPARSPRSPCAPTRCSASRCRSPCPASMRGSSTRARPGPTRPPTMPRPAPWSTCSAPTSPSSRPTSTPTCWRPRPSSSRRRSRAGAVQGCGRGLV